MSKVDMVIDLQYGSTGKGLIAGYLAETYGHDVVINANMPNAGHTYRRGNRTWIHKVLPNGIVSPGLKRVMIGPGSVFDVEQLLKEYYQSEDLLKNVEILIHPAAVPLIPEYAQTERDTMSKISSTMQGSGAALVAKIMRPTDKSVIWRDVHQSLKHKLPGNIVCAGSHGWDASLISANKVLAEGAQGYSLGINAGFYPYCTSRDCTPSRFMADMGIPHKMMGRVIGTLRTYPIRVGNTADGFSGDCYGDQKEVDWASIGVEPETTTVTKRVRRVFTFSWHQFHDSLQACRPDDVFLNFVNYLGEEVRQKFIEDVADLAWCYGARLAFLGHGPTFDDVEYIPLTKVKTKE